MEGIILILLIYILFILISYRVEKGDRVISPYECGFRFRRRSRKIFSYRFFLISILFLIFDVEIVLMMVIPFVWGRRIGVLIFLLFIIVLLVGVLYEYYYGSLDWLDRISKA